MISKDCPSGCQGNQSSTRSELIWTTSIYLIDSSACWNTSVNGHQFGLVCTKIHIENVHNDTVFFSLKLKDMLDH